MSVDIYQLGQSKMVDERKHKQDRILHGSGYVGTYVYIIILINFYVCALLK